MPTTELPKPEVPLEQVSPKNTTLYSNPVTEILNQYTKYIGHPVWDYVVNKTVPKLLEKTKVGQGGIKDIRHGIQRELAIKKQLQ